MKKNTFASVRVVEATPVKPKYPATTETGARRLPVDSR
jgi:hypothetical protein